MMTDAKNVEGRALFLCAGTAMYPEGLSIIRRVLL
jgi:hypothetical protein